MSGCVSMKVVFIRMLGKCAIVMLMFVSVKRLG